ncbi:ribose-phosphate pyrophosphokinase [Legionella worsleiensis]|uniref:ribose-phosphate diphosphokinase n=1 Tax=Legionella worsleiensis TaxID=45076 RepID=A0A0W1A362_9GAMM|nr:ribose-phosphate pyrophosphokinase [Legionella worsleiensis]KTD75781.1 phosphoribosylpyrophosphate synthetase [Legionella worsleiensis]STY32799.1 ribose-phosphate pyrophosphokinase [Legionella worsleiensis]
MDKKPLVFPLFDFDALACDIHTVCGYELGTLSAHQFPDGETVIKIESEVMSRSVFLIASLDTPNPKIAPLIFAAETARSLGASKVVLIAPYLAYMRQDKVFESGQGITSQYFARLISHYFDGLITVDPHLHRWHSLNELYQIPTQVLHAALPIARWIKNNIKKPLLIGPDEESRQWVHHIADEAGAPFVVLEKHRKGDHAVEISIPKLDRYLDKTPVLIDDIISTGKTMIEAVGILQRLKLPAPVCIGVHALFVQDAFAKLSAAGVRTIVTCNTIRHSSNAIDMNSEIVHFLKNKAQ